MNCTNYRQLTPIEKVMFIGKLHHAAQNDDDIFNICNEIIEGAEKKGLFEGVQIIPKTKEDHPAFTT